MPQYAPLTRKGAWPLACKRMSYLFLLLRPFAFFFTLFFFVVGAFFLFGEDFFAGVLLVFFAEVFLAEAFFVDDALAPAEEPVDFWGPPAAASIADQSTFLVVATPGGKGKSAKRSRSRIWICLVS